ncbi:immunity-related GTPase family Q protein-like [Onychomys torridus]|uniref:immunity-related GTPase family Q protein-like n=1 Tax=Onychomys torridus TaxID=38674 RepID=UPI00167F7E97|nr:immunity-related GTPase family Q protein-like [Onychomys torridus]
MENARTLHLGKLRPSDRSTGVEILPSKIRRVPLIHGHSSSRFLVLAACPQQSATDASGQLSRQAGRERAPLLGALPPRGSGLGGGGALPRGLSRGRQQGRPSLRTPRAKEGRGRGGGPGSKASSGVRPGGRLRLGSALRSAPARRALHSPSLHQRLREEGRDPSLAHFPPSQTRTLPRSLAPPHTRALAAAAPPLAPALPRLLQADAGAGPGRDPADRWRPEARGPGSSPTAPRGSQWIWMTFSPRRTSRSFCPH